MTEKIVDGIVVLTNKEDMTEEEIRKYIEYTNEHYQNDYKTETLTSLEIIIDENGKAKVDYEFGLPKFDRIRRITGSR